MLASEVPIGAVQARRVYIYLAIFFLFYPNLTIRYVQFFAIAKTSVVCNVRAPYSGGWNFRQHFSAILYLRHPSTSVQNFTEIVPGEPRPSVALNARPVSRSGISSRGEFLVAVGYNGITVLADRFLYCLTRAVL